MMVTFDICAGNPGALQFLMQAYDMDMFKAEQGFQRMQRAGITGARLYMPYLIEETEHGSPRLLFPSEDAVREYQEREELKEWVRVAAGWDKIGRYTLEQLRAVKKILEG